MTKIRMFEIGNFDANNNLICKSIFPAQSEASAKQLYCLNPYVCCDVLKKFDWCNIDINHNKQAYYVYLNSENYIEFSLDRARNSYHELIDYDNCGNEIRPTNDIVNWLCNSIQKSIEELNRQCARSYKTQL